MAFVLPYLYRVLSSRPLAPAPGALPKKVASPAKFLREFSRSGNSHPVKKMRSFSSFSHGSLASCVRQSNNNKNRLLCSQNGGFPVRLFSSWGSRGYDLNQDSVLDDDGRSAPRIVLEGFSESGFQLLNVVKNMKDKKPARPYVAPASDDIRPSTAPVREGTGSLYVLDSSILLFPRSVLLWDGRNVMDLVGPVLLHHPQLEFLFIGRPSHQPMHPRTIQELQRTLNDYHETLEAAARSHAGTHVGKQTNRTTKMVVEQMGIAQAIGTYNVLNSEGRQVAVALIFDPKTIEDE